MSSNRVTGPGSPDANRSQSVDSKTQRESAQKIEKVREVDPDEQARQRRRDQFQAMMSDNDDTDTAPHVPSPFETQFYSTDDSEQSSQFSNLKDAAVPSPQYSPPPTLKAPNLENMGTNTDLPQSDEFWSNVELPDQPIAKPTYKDAADGKTGATGKKTGKTIEPSPFGVPGKPVAKTELSGTSKSEKGRVQTGSKKEPDATPTGRFWNPETQPFDAKITPPKESNPFAEKGKSSAAPPVEGEQGFKDKKKKSEDPFLDQVVPTLSSATTPLPGDIQTAAQQAVTVASPYLSPEVLPLFYQMVGSIMVMTNYQPGVSKTEVLLNSPAFARSKFYGATLEIVKYASAPDSLNIRLTGSNEAVMAFRQNMPSLLAAFQQSNFQFKIGRLEAHYAPEKPVFHRKEKGLKGETGGGDLGGGK
jgi:hypothetical protein